MSDFTDGYIYVDYSQMGNAADDMISQTKAIATTLSNLEMELSELRNSWIGDDKDVYSQKQQAWDNAVKAMEELLTKHSTLLTSVSENYQYSEQSLTQMWDSVKIGR
ncbi:WXG100 family type VII secretion target [Streptomyces sp. NBS 14/10]|uniref:WXG100 family type VII secretion target n=1 Tax=Streptomyces sp. NBS 14/10 TaxID=1945643 RepID=UPI000B7C8C8D|nr:WXG100 family type VII secretion target [Streptomyces sp. NBS 14/10]KAK1182923.1 WXG100 family type VII secretion target [Streptomyces sp. NBS 14/10]NUS82928.1 WXG100 family type VII secretion target [Streptomyces sp.]